jgi:F-type H+-transporting ATPase subunit delta
MSQLARPYAQALLGAAGSVDAAEGIRGELEQFQQMTRDVPDLAKMTVNPSVPIEVKERILGVLAQEAEFAPLTTRFLTALLTRHRLGHLDEILIGIRDLLNRERGVVIAEVKSAQPLSSAESEHLTEVLAARLGKDVELDLDVDPSLLAGFVVRIGSNYYDASVKGQLDRLTADLARV